MNRLTFVKTYGTFDNGLRDMMVLCRPVRDTIDAGMQESVSLASAINSTRRSLIQTALAGRAQRMGGLTGERALHLPYGFSYRCASGCAFGWADVGNQGFNFFVRTDRFFLRWHREELVFMLTSAGWLPCAAAYARGYVCELHNVVWI